MDKLNALATHLECDVDELEESTYNDSIFELGNQEYLVLDDEEADAAIEDNLDSLLDEGGIVEGSQGPYFDREAWKRDARMDGRGHFLAGYDGDENESGEYFVYRLN